MEKKEPLTSKLDMFKDILIMGRGIMVEFHTWRVTVSFCSILKKFSGIFSGKVGNSRVGGSGNQNQNFASEMETRCTKIKSEFTSS